jgi:hypothetical protein
MAALAVLHRAGVRIGQRHLLVRCGVHLHFECLKLLHLLLERINLLL